MEFTVLNSPRGFRSSLWQRPHFIRFISFKLLLSYLYQPSFVIKMEVTVLNSPRGFWSSFRQRPHFIRFIRFISFKLLLSHLYEPSFESFVMLVFEAQPAILTGAKNNNQRPTTTRTATPAKRGGAMIGLTGQGMDGGLPNNNQPILHAALCQTPRAKQAARQQRQPLWGGARIGAMNGLTGVWSGWGATNTTTTKNKGMMVVIPGWGV